jgi:hypothetical protein
MEWSKQQYSQQKEAWLPWLEDIYLRWFTKDNKASYTTKRECPDPHFSQPVSTAIRKGAKARNVLTLSIPCAEHLDSRK